MAAGLRAVASAADVLGNPAVRATFSGLLESLAAVSPGSSTRVVRMVLVAEPPSMDKGEITDKGSMNQRAVLANRAALVEALYATPLPGAAIALAEAA
jgi:feruloyl-CoA synthase